MDDAMMAGLAPARAERRQITAVFVDIVGASEIASQSDPEDLQHWLEDFYQQTRSIVLAGGGEVTEYLGDGLVALFGLNRADELAASKAVNTALAAMSDIDAGRDKGVTLQLRIGIATGEAVLRPATALENLPRATGMVTTLAKRIQEKAEPGTILMSESTHALLRSRIETQAFQGETLRGFPERQTLYRPVANRPAPVSAQPIFVGRDSEITQIREEPLPVALIGPAGIGKSALTRKLAGSYDQATTFAADGAQIPHSYQPFRQWLADQLGRGLPDLQSLQATFPLLTPKQQNALALVLGLAEGQALMAQHSNVALRALIEESIWLAIQSAQPEGLLIFEDLHWLDNASFGVLDHITKTADRGRHQIILTSRHCTRTEELLERRSLAQIVLAPLSDEEAAALLDALSGGGIKAAVRDAVISRAAGIPLFVEHLFKRGAAQSGQTLTLPGTLKDLLAEQIDSTGAAKPVLQCAAVIGRTFSSDLLAELTGGRTELAPLLAMACDRGVLRRIDGTHWKFAHALLHRAAYDSLLRQDRVAHHAQIAQFLQDHRVDAVLRNPALLTEHLRLSEQYVPAIQNYLSVSQWAYLHGAIDDAETHVRAAIAMCEKAPADIDVRALHIACYSALGSILMQTQGFTAAPAKAAFETVGRLASSQDAFSPAIGPALYGSFTHAIILGDKPAARQFSDLLCAVADHAKPKEAKETLQLASLNVEAALHFYTGDFAKVSTALDALRRGYDIAKDRTMIASYGADTFAATLLFDTVARSICGQSHLVEDLISEADRHMRILDIPVMQPWAQIWGAVPLFYSGNHDAAYARVQKGLRFAQEQTAEFWQITGNAWLHVMMPEKTDTHDGLAGFAQVIAHHEAIGANIGLPYFRAHYALALARHDRIDEAYLTSLQATRDGKKSGLHCWYPEVLRIHGRICQLHGSAGGAVRFRSAAAAMARQQGAGLWLLRTRIDQFATGEINAETLQGTLDRFDARACHLEVAHAQIMLASA